MVFEKGRILWLLSWQDKIVTSPQHEKKYNQKNCQNNQNRELLLLNISQFFAIKQSNQQKNTDDDEQTYVYINRIVWIFHVCSSPF